jgi:hypothetical protein
MRNQSTAVRSGWRSGATWLALVAMLLVATSAFAQSTTGNIFGSVADDSGAPLPGVTVKLTGVGAPQTAVTDAQGQFRFPALPIGGYKIEATLDGFSTIENPNIQVSANRNASIQLVMNAAIQDVITVTTESPIIDERKVTAGASISNLELEKVPTARDPWALLSQTPGVQTDRINVGGNESGQQSVYVSAGAGSDETTWSVDGVNITDMSSISSPSYFDFDVFEEVQFTTGGSDVSLESAGVTVNIVTKRGGNDWRGSARYNLTDGDTQSDPDIASGDFGRNNNGPGGTPRAQNPASFIPNSINEVKEYGLETGGPIVKDRAWIWAGYGKNDPIDNVVGSTGQHDITVLENLNGKINGQITSSNSANVQYSTNDKLKDGRGAGADRAPETTTDQSGEGGNPTSILKVEDTQVVNSNFYVTGMYSFVDGGFQLVPKGGVGNPVWKTADGVYRGSYYFLYNNRDVTQYKADGSTFFNTGAVSHELKFGASQRQTETSSNFGFSGNFWVYDCSISGCNGDEVGPNTKYLNIWRDSNSVDEGEFNAVWLQDTMAFGNLTLNAGVRYETATGEVLAANIPAVTRGGVTFLAGINAPSFDPNVEYKELMPRFGATYSLGQERKTLLRASLARFAQQFVTGNYTRLGSTGTNSRLAGCLFNDANNNFAVDPNEVGSIDASACIPVSYNPANPTNSRTPNITDANLSPALTDELLLSVEHALRPEFVVSASLLYRQVTDIQDLQPLLRENGVVRVAQRGDYVQRTATAGGRQFTYFARRPGVTSAGGTFLTNGDREQEALGLTLGFNKRLSNRWMMRGHAQYTDWTWKVPDSYFDHNDPTNFGDGAGNIADGDRDGEVVAERSGGSGSKTGVFLNAKWSASLTGMYQVAPDRAWGFNVSGALNAREGYPNPAFVNITGTDGTTRSVQVFESLDDVHNDDVMTMDLRVDKEIAIGDNFGVTVGVDVFNLFNDNTVLQRNRNFTSTSFNFINETIAPRIIRGGVRLTFK